MVLEADLSQFPIIILKSLPVEISDNDIEEYLQYLEKFLSEANEKVVIIYDVNLSRFINGDQTVRISKWAQEKHPLFKEKTLGTAVVTSSILSNLIIKGIRFLTKQQFDAEVFSNMEAAIAWGKKLIQEQNS
jgi:hypothetical protein